MLQVLHQGNMQTLHDKPIEIKRAVPREQMPAGVRGGARPAAAYAAMGRTFGSPLAKSAALGLSSLSANGVAGQGFAGLGPRISLTPGSLSIPAVRSPNGLADYADCMPDGIDPRLSSAQGLELLSGQPSLGQLDRSLGSLGVDDLALLQSSGLAASLGRGSAGLDISAAQSLPGSLEEVLQGLQLGQYHSRQGVTQAAYSNDLLASVPGSLAQSDLSTFGLMGDGISAGQHW